MGKGRELLSKIKSVDTDVQLVVKVSLGLSIPKNITLKDGSSKDMAIDGTTPAEFEIAPGNDEIMIISEIPLTLIDDGASMLPQNFGGVGVLTNGVELVALIDGVEDIICNLKDNKDLLNCFYGGVLGSGLVGATGFFETVDFVSGSFNFDAPLLLNGQTNDRLFIRIQDDLAALGHFEASANHIVLPL